eukprot:2484979-Prymnesium_polylepis.2
MPFTIIIRLDSHRVPSHVTQQDRRPRRHLSSRHNPARPVRMSIGNKAFGPKRRLRTNEDVWRVRRVDAEQADGGRRAASAARHDRGRVNGIDHVSALHHAQPARGQVKGHASGGSTAQLRTRGPHRVARTVHWSTRASSCTCPTARHVRRRAPPTPSRCNHRRPTRPSRAARLPAERRIRRRLARGGGGRQGATACTAHMQGRRCSSSNSCARRRRAR